MIKDVGKDYTVALTYSSNKEKPLLTVKDGEIKKDILDKVMKTQSKSEKKEETKEIRATEKSTDPLDVEFNEPLTKEQQLKMDTYIEGGNSSDTAKSGLLKVEFDNSTRTYYVLFSDTATITDKDSIRKSSLETMKEIEMYVAGRVTVKVAYESKKDSPLLVLRNKKIIEDNLK